MEEKSLKEKTFSGLGWSIADKLCQQIFVFISGIYLAHKLGAVNYGLIGILAVFIGIANLLQESGFTSALIRKKDVTQADYVTVFYTNIGIGFFLYLLLFFLAPLIASYYEEPILTSLARYLFLSFLFNSFSVIQNSQLIKAINYRVITKINFCVVPFSYLVAIILAFLDFGVWALASQTVVLAFSRTVCLWIFGRWRPSGFFSVKIFKEYFAFGSKLVIGGIMNSFTSNVPQNIIAKQYSLGVTGFYSQAMRLFNTIFDFVAGTLNSVPFAVLSNIDNDERLKSVTRKFIRMKALITFPLFFGLMLISRPFIMSLLGASWEPTIPILQILCVGGIFTSLDYFNSDILRIKGRSGLILSFEIFRNVLIFCVIGFVLLVKLNYLYMILGFSVVIFIKYIVNSIFTNRLIGYTFIELVKDLLPYFITSLFCIICGYFLKFLMSGIFLMISQIVFVGVLYFVILYSFNSILLKEIIVLVRSKLPKLR